ncbi:acyl-CoA dehydrogenase family protein [Marinobacterium rhizophilum]|uniref:Acyl-CoA dehydrogenase family protein n=1 Tax=Marinobacterium rhizophilum TaxID=420402 RepID=A0ABY5HIT6_9GAMM|nr:acyl-CoA dehydrogenase [Marinobacterium rhizophilum]UTW12285.1 acyl-CoA dehydrogenase family protein [Marinobacterium rhizophilum]
MSLIYNEEQRMLLDTAQEFFAERSPVAALRALRDRGDEQGFDSTLWRDMAELGWTAIPFPESLGGLEFGYKGMGAVFESAGRYLSASPLLSSIVLCGSVLEQGGSEAQQSEWLAALIDGSKRLALAVDEGPRHEPEQIGLCARCTDNGFELNGDKVMVVDGLGADGWIVAARTEESAASAAVEASATGKEGISLFIVPAGTAGVNLSRQALIDSRNTARLSFSQVQLSPQQLIGELDQGTQVLEAALDRGRACIAAELQGACEQLFQMTLDYLRTRVQFDTFIGSFQALQHRAAWAHVELELARSSLMAALDAIDSQDEQAAQLVSLAKWKVGQMADRISNEAVQLHGGIGVTDELDVGLYFKRIRVLQALLGDSDYHLSRASQVQAAA